PYAGEYSPTYPLYVVAEKILTENETLPLDWTINGTTGYDFMTDVNNLFVARENEAAFDEIYRRFTGHPVNFEALVMDCKEMIMTSALISEINTLAHRLDRITERNRRYRDFTLNSLIDALREVIAHLHIYRTYIRDMERVSERDQYYIELAVTQALKRNTLLPSAIFDFLRDTLQLRNITEFAEEDRQEVLDFVMKFQQVTGPIMAKSMEDTAFYIYNRLVSLNEVGGHPDQFGISVSVYHEHNLYRMRRWPNTMLATSTHDTKRSEDVRTRISILSEIPEEWEAAVTQWREINAGAKTTIDGDVFPAQNDEYLLYQTLIGVLPFGAFDIGNFRDRINRYMEKAAQEAKVNSSWLNPNRAYLDALKGFIDTILVENSPFLQAFVPFQRRIAYYGQFNALAQTLLKLTAPGLPDTYQGAELWDFSLVDPDNRRPVDYDQRRHLLESLLSAQEDRLALAAELLESSTDGRIKLYLIQRTLQFRRDHPQLFETGKYQPLEVRGERWSYVCAFMRHDEDDVIVVIVPRLPLKLTAGVERPPLGSEIWHDTWLTLPDNQAGWHFKDLFTDEIVAVETRDGVPALPLASALASFPVTLLQALPDTDV
ncbi:MAG: malto-oligosyltrehalose synthase, partial [Anaerolineae bacterium]|nr:malto-oligosyltrehalose synthase [Anaerolineae bacterium]